MFLQNGAIGLQLNPDKISYLNLIRSIAIKKLVSTTSNLSHNKLYEIDHMTKYNHNTHLYKHHYNDTINPKYDATFIKVRSLNRDSR